MRHLSLFFFIVRLLGGLIVLGWQMVTSNFNWSPSLLIASGLCLYQILFFFDYRLALRRNLVLLSQQLSSNQERQQNLIKAQAQWGELLLKQPHHRDVLYNLSLITKESGDLKKSQEYLNQAIFLDPNN